MTTQKQIHNTKTAHTSGVALRQLTLSTDQKMEDALRRDRRLMLEWLNGEGLIEKSVLKIVKFSLSKGAIRKKVTIDGLPGETIYDLLPVRKNGEEVGELMLIEVTKMQGKAPKYALLTPLKR